MRKFMLFNTMSRRLECFEPMVENQASMYTCGPTVYNYAHIGNFRAYLFEDLLRRSLAYCGYKVTQVMNLTDVDDKTIRDSRAAGIELRAYTQKYKDAFFADLKSLHVQPAEYYPAATDHIPEMIALIQTLMDKGFAYQAEDKCIYFSIAKFPHYGKLAHIDRENQRVGVRVSTDEYEKESMADFALWKAWDQKDGDVVWDSPWGRGRPGWHIECSAMSMKYLGKTFDIHTGGVDNMFPHHEDEIAQSECANGCTFVNYWLHNEHLIVNGAKMSKSAGNFYTVRQLLDQGYKGTEIRYALLAAHYRKKLNFSLEMLSQARQMLQKFEDLFLRLKTASGTDARKDETTAFCAQCDEKFGDAVADDLNISEASAVLFGALTYFNKRLAAGDLGTDGAEAARAIFRKMDTVLAYLDVDAAGSEVVPDEITALVEARQAARKAKDFARSDAIRDELKEKGYMIEDTPSGPRAKRL